MTPTETVKLVGYINACCPQQAMDEYTADAWHDLLSAYGLDECRRAVVTIASRQPFVAASEVITEVGRQRRADLGRKRREQLERDIPAGAICARPGDDRMVREDIDKIFEDFRQRLGQPVPVPAAPPRPQMSQDDFEAERRRQLAALELMMAEDGAE